MSTSVKHVIADSSSLGLSGALRRWETLLLGVLVLVVVFGSLSLKEFLDPYNLADSTFNFSEKALIALAMALLGATVIGAALAGRAANNRPAEVLHSE